MDKKIKKKWLKALRSGKYKQGRDALRIGNKFCCLGVLCDLVDSGPWVEAGDDFDDYYYYAYEYYFLPDKVVEESKLGIEAQEKLSETGGSASEYEQEQNA